MYSPTIVNADSAIAKGSSPESAISSWGLDVVTVMLDGARRWVSRRLAKKLAEAQISFPLAKSSASKALQHLSPRTPSSHARRPQSKYSLHIRTNPVSRYHNPEQDDLIWSTNPASHCAFSFSALSRMNGILLTGVILTGVNLIVG